MEITTQNASETTSFGQQIGASLKGGEIFTLSGAMGAGKTTFVQGLAKALHISDRVNSPTFIIMREYPVTEMGPIQQLYHVDLYRLETNINEELDNLGILDLWGKPENVFVIEWSEKIPQELLVPNVVNIKISVPDELEDTRVITIH